MLTFEVSDRKILQVLLNGVFGNTSTYDYVLKSRNARFVFVHDEQRKASVLAVMNTLFRSLNKSRAETTTPEASRISN